MTRVAGNRLSESGLDGEHRGDGDRDTRIHVLGGFRFLRGDAELWLPDAAERLLAVLAVWNRPLRRAECAAVFWPDASEKQALANLRSTLWRLVGPPHEALDIGARSVGVRVSVQVDYRQSATLAGRLVDRRCSVATDELVAASARLRQDLLPGWYDDWAVAEAERWRQLRLHALEALARRLSEVGCFAQALDAALLSVAADPLRESAHAEVIRVHLAEHNRSEAIRAYDRYCTLAHSELGLAPSQHLRDLLSPPSSFGLLAVPDQPTGGPLVAETPRSPLRDGPSGLVA